MELVFSNLRSKCVNSIPLGKLGPFGRRQRVTGLNIEKNVEYCDLLGLSHGCLHPCKDLRWFIDTHRRPGRAIKYADIILRSLDINMPDKSQEEMRLNLRILDSDKRTPYPAHKFAAISLDGEWLHSLPLG